jgi:xanthine dehydrogenase FAD-binding subunit
MIWENYYTAYSIDDAIQALINARGSACPIGGGTDLLLEIQQGHKPAYHTLVDVTRIPELNSLKIDQNILYIGASVPVSRVANSELVQQIAPAICEACALIGGPQVRNTATLGGNVAHALPAADGMIALVAMDAGVEIASPGGRRVAPILTLFRGPGQSALDLRREIVVGFHIPVRQPNQGCAFSRVMRPQGVALPILNMSVWLQREGDRVKDVHLAVGPAGPIPQRANPVEEAIRGCVYNEANTEAAIDVWQTTMRFRTSPQRASAEYRRHLCAVLFREVFGKAWQRSFDPVRR